MMRSAKLKAAVVTTVTAMVAAAPRLANACATCGLSDADHALHAYKASTLFLVASPYVSFAVIGGVTFLAYRRSRRQDRKSVTTR
jgi:hypothetical protein